MNTTATFYHEHFYHIYNQTNNKERLFRSNENRAYFLRRYQHYLAPFLSLHSYSLLGNHFHLSVRIKNSNEITAYISTIPSRERSKSMNQYLEASDHNLQIDSLIINQHQRFFISYSQSFNKMYNRQGNLFNRQFKRSLFDPSEKFKQLQYYIHHNARKHGIVKDFLDHDSNSYLEITESDSHLVDTAFVLDFFGGAQQFISYHNSIHFMDEFHGLIIEEEPF